MEVYGAVASTAALLELTTKLAKLFHRAGTAKETWQRYSDELFLIHQVIICTATLEEVRLTVRLARHSRQGHHSRHGWTAQIHHR